MKNENDKDNKIYDYKVKIVKDKKMGGYEGMNYYAGKAMGFNSPRIADPHTVIVNSIYHGHKKREIIKHEIKEAELMKLGHPYMYSHKHANKVEHKPYCKCLINTKNKR